jgi:hypothetical protein
LSGLQKSEQIYSKKCFVGMGKDISNIRLVK